MRRQHSSLGGSPDTPGKTGSRSTVSTGSQSEACSGNTSRRSGTLPSEPGTECTSQSASGCDLTAPHRVHLPHHRHCVLHCGAAVKRLPRGPLLRAALVLRRLSHRLAPRGWLCAVRITDLKCAQTFQGKNTQGLCADLRVHQDRLRVCYDRAALQVLLQQLQPGPENLHSP